MRVSAKFMRIPRLTARGRPVIHRTPSVCVSAQAAAASWDSETSEVLVRGAARNSTLPTTS